MSPDGAHVYLASSFSVLNAGDTLAVFDRDAGTGEVTLRQVFQHGKAGVDGLDGATSIVTSPDGQFVYVSSDGPLENTIDVVRHAQVECSPAPLGTCFQAGKAKLLLKAGSSPAKNKLAWKWLKGEALTVGDFGDPAATLNDYVLCLYDGSGGGAFLEGLAAAGGGCGSPAQGGATPCWKAKGTIGFAYKSATRSPHGISPVKLLAGADGSSKVIAKGKGESLPFPALPLALPVTVQLQNADGACWEAVYPTAVANDGLGFKALAP